MLNEIDKFYGKRIFIKKFSNEKYREIIEFNKNFKNIDWSQMLYNYINNIDLPPKCNCCEINIVKFLGFSAGYKQTCSKKCRYNSKSTKEKRKKTCIIKYGCENPQQNKEIRKKTVKTSLEKYGTECSLLNEKVNKKSRETCIEKYGVEYPSQNSEIREKIEQKNIDNFGVKCNLMLDSNKEQVKQTNLKKYGTEYGLQNEEIKEKSKQTCLKKYGVEYSTQSNESKKKKDGTNIERYGVKSPTQNEEIKEKTKQTNIIKFGFENPQQNKEIKNKSKKTNLERYGCENPSQNKEINKKIKNTKQEKYKKDIAKLINLDISNIKLTDNTIIIDNYCSKHSQFEIDKDLFYDRIHNTNNKICTQCYSVNDSSSISEKEIKEFLVENNISILENDILILNKLELDVLIPDNKLAIEYNGLFWHSTKFKDIKYHLNKTIECEKQEIQLLHVFEDEWLHKKEVVKSIIKSKLNRYNHTINFSDCKIIELDENVAKNFIIENSINEYNKSNIQLGLYYNNELVYVMSINEFNNGLNIINFCNKLNNLILDVENNLIDFLIKKYSQTKIIISFDRRYYSEKNISLNNFKLVKVTEPHMWYFSVGKRIKYYNDEHKKHCLNIYDCGSLIYEYNA